MGDSEIVNTPDYTRYVHRNETETPLDVRGLKRLLLLGNATQNSCARITTIRIVQNIYLTLDPGRNVWDVLVENTTTIVED